MLKFNQKQKQAYKELSNLNTSYVKVQFTYVIIVKNSVCHLNTSYVKVQYNFLLIHINCSFLFKYILC